MGLARRRKSTRSCLIRGPHRMPTDDQPLQADLLTNELSRVDLATKAGQHADQRDVAANASRQNGLLEGLRSAHLDHMVDALDIGVLQLGNREEIYYLART